jgi:chemosensory pili system protein ChpA (sensor histidine kinase/response regulator)
MPRTVLVVDDADVCATLLEIALSGVGDANIRTAHSATEALRILAQPDVQVAALVTDLQLPRVDGFELIRIIRSQPRHATLPVIVFSGLASATVRDRLQALGVRACFEKPCSPGSIRRVLEDVLNGN